MILHDNKKVNNKFVSKLHKKQKHILCIIDYIVIIAVLACAAECGRIVAKGIVTACNGL